MSSGNVFKVFVYGTLKNGQPNHYWLTKLENGISRFIANGKTVKQLPLVVATRYNIPFLLDRPGTGHLIHGEVYEVNENMLKRLDILEDYPNFYDREIQEIQTEELGKISCWVYLLKKFPETLLQKPLLEEYKETKAQPYLERSKRTENIFAKDDLEY